jgi:hypothetical protein
VLRWEVAGYSLPRCCRHTKHAGAKNKAQWGFTRIDAVIKKHRRYISPFASLRMSTVTSHCSSARDASEVGCRDDVLEASPQPLLPLLVLVSMASPSGAVSDDSKEEATSDARSHFPLLDHTGHVPVPC